jgi:hypothetical protein
MHTAPGFAGGFFHSMASGGIYPEVEPHLPEPLYARELVLHHASETVQLSGTNLEIRSTTRMLAHGGFQ